MKLIYCPECKDVVKLRRESVRTCFCGASQGIYVDKTNAKISGKAIPLCIGWRSFMLAIRNRPTDRFDGERFQAWIPPVVCSSIEYNCNEELEKGDNECLTGT